VIGARASSFPIASGVSTKSFFASEIASSGVFAVRHTATVHAPSSATVSTSVSGSWRIVGSKADRLLIQPGGASTRMGFSGAAQFIRQSSSCIPSEGRDEHADALEGRQGPRRLAIMGP
jgi:hypothetical protein